MDVLDQLITPLSTHIFSVLAAPSETPSGRQLYLETKKEYLNLLNNIISSKLHVVFTSEREFIIHCRHKVSLKVSAGNKGGFENILTIAVQIAQDFSDNNGQKLAFSLLSRTITVWGQPGPRSNGTLNEDSTQIPGFDRFVYEQLVPVTFQVPSSPQFNVKDGQMMVVRPCIIMDIV